MQANNGLLINKDSFRLQNIPTIRPIQKQSAKEILAFYSDGKTLKIKMTLTINGRAFL
jgi:hypothetical protein